MWYFVLVAAMSWDFFVPVCVGDLLKTGGMNQYMVQEVLSPAQLPSHLNSKHQILFFYFIFTPVLVTLKRFFCLCQSSKQSWEARGLHVYWITLTQVTVCFGRLSFDHWVHVVHSWPFKGVKLTLNFLRHCNSEVGIKEDALAILVQGWSNIVSIIRQCVFGSVPRR